MLIKIGGDIITHNLSASQSFHCTIDITGKIKQLYASVCGNNSMIIGSERSNIFHCIQAAKNYTITKNSRGIKFCHGDSFSVISL